MRWAPLHPRQMVAIMGATLLAMLLLMLLAAPELGSLDFSIGSDAGSSTDTAAPMPDRVEVSEASPPVWVTDPLAAPLDTTLDPSQ